MKDEIQVVRTYEVVPSDTAIIGAWRLVEEGEGQIQSYVQRGIEFGTMLLAKKESLGHGNWLPWLTEKMPFTEMTATKYMRVAGANLNRGLDFNSPQPRLEDAPSIRAALRQIAADSPPRPRPKPEAYAPREVAFSWFKQDAVIYGEEGEKALENEIQVLAHADKDKKVAKEILKHLSSRLLRMSKQAEKASGRL